MPTIANDTLPDCGQRTSSRAVTSMHWRKRYPPALGWIMPGIEDKPDFSAHARIAWTGVTLLVLIFVAGIVGEWWGGQWSFGLLDGLVLAVCLIVAVAVMRRAP